jgi:glucose/arabinose dehydrogenase
VKQFLLYGALVAILLVAVCCTLLPERFAVNAPIANLLFDRGIDAPSQERARERLRAAEGFQISLYAADLPNARMLRATSAGDLLVSTPRAGEVWLVERDADGDGRADGRRKLLSELERPHGLELHGGWLYVAEDDAVGRIRFDPQTRQVSGRYERFITGIPSGGNHWSRTVRVGPDEKLYLSVGSSCNVCIEKSPKRAAMLRYEIDGSGEEIYATGLRNSVGFDWRPGTGELFAADNGRDLLGDDFPPCELNRIEEGAFYGWPFANGDRVPDPDLGKGREREIAASRPPDHPFRAHNAPLGMTFIRSRSVPETYRGAAIVALHGSWNRTKKDGYKVVSLHWQKDGRIEERDFITGFEEGGDVIGRPVDVAEAPDGSLYISDDYAGAIWRVRHGER